MRPINDPQTIHIDEGTLNWVYQNFHKQFSRPPTQKEMDILIDAHITAEVKHREGLALKLDVGDIIIQRRMMQKIDFLYGGLADSVAPKETILRQWYKDNQKFFMPDSKISFEHIYFNPDNHGNVIETVAKNILKAFRENHPDAQYDSAIDPFPHGQFFNKLSIAEARRLFGYKFTENIFQLPLGLWAGPVESGYGVHLIKISQLIKGQSPRFEDIKEDVTERWRQAENKRLFSEKIDQMKEDYQISFDPKLLEKFKLQPNISRATPRATP